LEKQGKTFDFLGETKKKQGKKAVKTHRFSPLFSCVFRFLVC